MIWCGRRDSNSHTFRHTALNRACLPIPPRPQIEKARDFSDIYFGYRDVNLLCQLPETVFAERVSEISTDSWISQPELIF